MYAQNLKGKNVPRVLSHLDQGADDMSYKNVPAEMSRFL